MKGALVGGIAGAVMAAGTVALASTSNFILGSTTANTPDAPTAVTAKNIDGNGGLNNQMIKLTNNSTGVSATALGLTTPPSRPPMIVSSGARVKNLNADKLDGFDSTALHVLWAVVAGTGTLARSTGTTGSIHLSTGNYQVTFNRDVSVCAYTATIGTTDAGATQGDIDVATRAGNNNAVFIETRNNSGTLADNSFHLMVAC